VLLIVKVAEPSLRGDRLVKAALHAGFGIAEYWVVGIAGGSILVHTASGEGGYASVRETRRGDAPVPPLLPSLALAVADMVGPPLDSPAPIL